MLDLHSHYLPAIDDGARSLEDSLAMLRLAAADGISAVVVTPHMYIDTFSGNTAEVVTRAYDQFICSLAESLAGEPDDSPTRPEVLLGAENFVNDRFVLHLEKGLPILTLNQSSYVLLEFPLFGVFHHMDRLMSVLFARGLSPLFAHPERNAQFQRDPQILHRLVDQGTCLQLDSMSLLGGFGAEAKTMAFYLLRNNLVHCIASDTHGADRRRPILSGAREVVARNYGDEKAELLFTENPGRIVRDLEVKSPAEASEPAPRRRSWFAEFFKRN